MNHYIEGKWCDGGNSTFQSVDPATGEVIWTGKEADKKCVDKAVNAAEKALPSWRKLPFSSRASYLENFGKALLENIDLLAKTISIETGKPLWESRTEAAAMINKIPVSIDAYKQRCPETTKPVPQGTLSVGHQPHGVMGVLGPYNFPGHLPNGHIIPALLAGNTIVFKPSELTPLVAEITVKFWEQSGIPPGVVNLVQGGIATGQALVGNPTIAGILFTGSWNTGLNLSLSMAKAPDKILALEMGGNNPMVIGTVKDKEAAAYLTIQSAFITSGQRCTCARRLFVKKGVEGDDFIRILKQQTQSIAVGAYTDKPEPFMGPMITIKAAQKMLDTEKQLIELGGMPILPLGRLPVGAAFITPGIIDVTAISELPDEEYFGPLLQVMRFDAFNEALQEANRTKFGLAAGLLSDNKEEFDRFIDEIRAGVINWNTPTTGASSSAPFGGIGRSGNNRPSALYAADYCAYPVASMLADTLKFPETLSPGIKR